MVDYSSSSLLFSEQFVNNALVNERQFVQAAAIDIGEGLGATLASNDVDIMRVVIYKHARFLAASIRFGQLVLGRIWQGPM